MLFRKLRMVVLNFNYKQKIEDGRPLFFLQHKMRTTVLNFNFKNKSRTNLKAAYSGSPRPVNSSRRRMRALEQCCPPRTMYLFSAASRCHTSTRIGRRVQPHRLKPLQHPLLSQWPRLAVLCAKVELWQVQRHCMGGDEYPISLN